MIIKLRFIYMINTLSCSEMVKIVTRLGEWGKESDRVGLCAGKPSSDTTKGHDVLFIVFF